MISCHDSPVALLDTNIIQHQGEEYLSGLTLSSSQFIHSYGCHMEGAIKASTISETASTYAKCAKKSRLFIPFIDFLNCLSNSGMQGLSAVFGDCCMTRLCAVYCHVKFLLVTATSGNWLLKNIQCNCWATMKVVFSFLL